MESKVQYRKQAIFLRQQGMTYGEILKEVPVSRATLSYWLRAVPVDQLTAFERSRRVEEKRGRARILAKIGRRVRQAEREQGVEEEAKKRWKKWHGEAFFHFGLGVYRVRGNQKGSQAGFSSADPALAALMQKWFVQYFIISPETMRYRLYAQAAQEIDSTLVFWAEKLGVSREIISVSTVGQGSRPEKEAKFQGVMSIGVPGVRNMKTVKIWQTQVTEYY